MLGKMEFPSHDHGKVDHPEAMEASESLNISAVSHNILVIHSTVNPEPKHEH